MMHGKLGRILLILLLGPFDTNNSFAGTRRKSAPPPVMSAGQGIAVDLTTYPPAQSYLVPASSQPAKITNVISVTKLQSNFNSLVIEGTCEKPTRLQLGLAETKVSSVPMFANSQTRIYFNCNNGYFMNEVKFADNITPGKYRFSLLFAGTNRIEFETDIDTERFFSQFTADEMVLTEENGNPLEYHWYTNSRYAYFSYVGKRLKPYWQLSYSGEATCKKIISTPINSRLAKIDLAQVEVPYTRVYYAKVFNPRAGTFTCVPATSFTYLGQRPTRVYEYTDIQDESRFSKRLKVFNPEKFLNARARPLSRVAREFMYAALPYNPEDSDQQIFERYSSSGSSVWKENWLQQFDFTGVGWDAPQDGTLITTRHVVFTAHFPRTGPIVFHDKDGIAVHRNIVSYKTIFPPMYGDLAIGLLDEEVPSSIKVYPILDLSRISHRAEVFTTPILVAEQNRRMFVHEYFKSTAIPSITFGMGFDSLISPKLAHYMTTGDSSNPGFIMLAGELFLALTLISGDAGSGLSYGDPYVYNAMQAAVEAP